VPRDPQTLVFVGIKDSVMALDDRTGEPVWRTKLRRSDFVSVLWDGEALIAANSGEVYRLDPQTGAVLWHNELKGMGLGLVTLATTRAPARGTGVATAKQERTNRAGAAAAAG
jgi:outer membrane protein assembly factor BamB